MIKFRQKEFIAPLVGMAGKAALSMAPDLIGSGINAIQTNQQNKANQEAQEKAREDQKKLQEQQLKTINKIAKKDPQAAASVMSQSMQPQQQQFSAKTYLKGLGSKYKEQAKKAFNDLTSVEIGKEDLKGFGKDVKHALWKNKDIATKKALFAGASVMGAFAGKKIVDHLRKKDEETEEREYSIKGDFIKRGVNHVKRVAKDNAGNLVFSGLTAAALPVAGHMVTKSLKKRMAEDLEEDEREFSIKGKAKRLAVGVRQYYRETKKDPLKRIIDFKSSVNHETLKKVSDDLSEGGSGSKLTKLVSDTVKNHPKTSMLIGGGIAMLGTKAYKGAKNKVQKGIDKLKNKKSSLYTDDYEIED